LWYTTIVPQTKDSSSAEKGKKMGRAKLTNKQVRDQGLPTLRTLSPKEVREWIGISQAELARSSGISRAAIADLETGRYKMSAANGIELYMALARAISPASSKEREKIRKEAFRLLAFQRELYRKKLIDIEYQAKKLQKQHEAIEVSVAELDSKEAQLQGIER
jgi:DNA-binding XRE family transcriptional regulator